MVDQSAEPPASDSDGSSAPPPPVEPLKLPTFEEMKAQDVFNNCAVKSIVSCVMGGGMGIFMGLLFGALDNPLNPDQMTVRQHFTHAAKQMGSKSLHMAKAFAVMGAIYSGTECIIEKARARHDMTNTMVAGCVTGGSLSAKAGPKAACVGCAGFAAFSVVVEKLFDRAA
ncbi:hypothetical protein SELMODRAFT_230551 [Selaginella moellendorffii]|uniref:Mitochondrial import inner membrane translocase subunit TIM22 n=1 Tax=Selaginella moellendorffii TaxID=88036 RepID=D8R2J7_SELML|nr:mitochondrial import inner membrane translocase subunit TIM22-4 [Selaginella moellendorffii]EFJ34081.1 hypothetical protein SELMODRAFT_230551 [Selaginella moellendorffii]|eukprot:XP_002965243.1 mitochondrial import inner membrane translocase subunit TIM22-4 [Selaginella moellendorffii]